MWRVEFNMIGNLLSVCSGDNQTSLYKEKVSGAGEWVLYTVVNEDGVLKE